MPFDPAWKLTPLQAEALYQQADAYVEEFARHGRCLHVFCSAVWKRWIIETHPEFDHPLHIAQFLDREHMVFLADWEVEAALSITQARKAMGE